ncbi:MAG: outer membrane protein assembly factor BamE [Alphaproteobacteria bacterium]|nr:outer membrane protein assembly factor BamE [Alphaproteobacteria bacterium]
MSHRAALMCSLGALAFALAACAPVVDQRGNLPDDTKLAQIQPGVTTKEAVSQLLGTPSSIATFSDKTWYYISRRTSQTAFFDPKILDQQVVVVAFDDGGVVRDVERRGLADARPIEPSARVTPSAGHELGILEQLVGNLGRFNTEGSGPTAFKRPGQSGTVGVPGTGPGGGY